MIPDPIARAFAHAGIEWWGACPFDIVSRRLIPCRAVSRLPEQARTVLCALFPYRTPDMPHNVSRYAFAPDYHGIVLGLLNQVAQELRETFPGKSFPCFADNSPIPEVYAAAASGLGCIGEHGLLIHPEYGSWVFIGEIVTDLSVGRKSLPPEPCLRCGACRRACPGGALTGDAFEKERCLSHLTQKKALTQEEERLVKKGSLVWGCDTCQEVCPMNRSAKPKGMEAFQEKLMPVIAPGEAAKLTDRAFCWRPPRVLERNLRIFKESYGNPNGEFID